MLFINFLCLLYLMVLADSHTISKSIYNDDKLDNNIFESIHDVDRPTNLKTRKDRQHKYKAYKDEDIAVPDSHHETKPYELDKTTEKLTIRTTNNKLITEHLKRHKTPKKRIGFWKKLRGKDKKKETNKHDSNDRNRRVSIHKKERKFTAKVSHSPGPKIKGRRKNKKKFSPRQTELKVSKRDASALISTRPYSTDHTRQSSEMEIAPQVDNMRQSKNRMKTQPTFSASVEALTKRPDSLIAQLESMTSKLSLLKKKYGYNAIQTASPLQFQAEIIAHPTTENQKTVATTEYNIRALAQIEVLLNSMKSRALQMASFEKPAVTGLIKSSATTATFNSEQFLRPVMPASKKISPTYVSIKDIHPVEKRTAGNLKPEEYNLNDFIFSAHTEPHYVAARSIKEDTMTIAQNVEDMLQRELKNLYNKVKHKVSSDLKKEVKTAKSTVKDSIKKLTSKLTSKAKANATRPTSTKPAKSTHRLHTTCACKTTTKPTKMLKTFASTTSPRLKKKYEEEDKITIDDKIIIKDNFTPDALLAKTYDDYVMLTLFEQMLSKTHENNLKKMLATSEDPIFPKFKRDTLRLSERNPETLTDVKLTEAIQNLYDEGANMPDYDYIEPSANVSSTARTHAANNYNDIDYIIDSSGSLDNSAQDQLDPLEANSKAKGTAPPPIEPDAATEANARLAEANIASSISDTSFEGLSNKISYNEFVNGYKHYLKFQKDQSNQNFSNLIRYQAHKHHSVDDIGKYILSKIPPLPTYRKRELRFSDESDNNMDYQEITTKSDDSWFRKHFYLFIDNGPPKKYHTSEMVELKPTEPKFITEPYSRIDRQTEQIFITIPTGVARIPKEVQKPPNLDDLTRVLESIKEKQIKSQLSQVSATKKNDQDASEPVIDNANTTGDATQVKSFISKLFGGKRRNAPKRDSITTVYVPTPNYMYTESLKERLRRAIAKENIENTIMRDMTKDIEGKLSNVTKELFADPAQIGKKESDKYGYVDIDLVPRQTAVVRLRDAKKSKFKTFFKKFHFKKKKKPHSKPKRSCYYNYYTQNRRRERFNPLKKLKAMFNTNEKSKDEQLAEKYQAPNDYGLASGPLEQFKPVNVEKPMSLSELQKQVPNISDVYFEPTTTTTARTTKVSYILDDKDEDLLSNFHPSSSLKSSTASKKKVTSKPTTLPIYNNATLGVAVPQASVSSKSHTKTRINNKKVPGCNVITVNLKTMKPTTNRATTGPPMTIEDMSFLLDHMQDKIQKNNEDAQRITTIYNTHVRHTGKKQRNKIFGTTLRSRNAGKPDLNPKQEFEELVIKSKLTRIAKFPITRPRYKKRRRGDSEPDIKIDKDYSSFDGPSVLEYIHDFSRRNVPVEKKKQAKNFRNSLRKIHHPQTLMQSSKEKDKYTDYFNDLVVWHNDILNMDTVPNPQWAKILKSIKLDEGVAYTTPNRDKLLIELKEMNDYIDTGGRFNTSVTNTFPNSSVNDKPKDHLIERGLPHLTKQGIIKSLAMHDNTLVTSKNLLIRGEAKYYQYNNSPRKQGKIRSSALIKKLDRMSTREEKVPFKWKGSRRCSPSTSEIYPESTIIVDTTLMAYDDDVDSVTKALEPRKKSRNAKKHAQAIQGNKTAVSSKNNKKKMKSNDTKPENAPSKNKSDHSTLLKTNKAPVQYYTTPLPMKSKDFNKFLKDHDMDVDFVTSPMLDMPEIKEWNGGKINNKESSISTTTAMPKQGTQGFKPTYQGATPPVQKVKPANKEAPPPIKEVRPANQKAGPRMQEPPPPTQEVRPANQEAGPRMLEAPPPMHEVRPDNQEGRPADQKAASPIQDAALPKQGVMKESLPPMPAVPESMQDAFPPMQEAPQATQETPPRANPNAWTTRPSAPKLSPTEYTEPKTSTKAKDKTTEHATTEESFSKQFKAKVESITKAISKSVKFTSGRSKSRPRVNPKPAIDGTNNLAFWDDFDRHKRYTELKLARNTAKPKATQEANSYYSMFKLPRNPAKPNRATQEANYYSILKKKMKEKLFEKKATATAPMDRPATYAVDPQNKEVEITIINFDDIDKMTTHFPYETFNLAGARRDEIGTFTDFADLSSMLKKTKSTAKITTDSLLKEDMHNELLYKDIFNEQQRTTSINKNPTKDLSTEYVPVVNDVQTINCNKMRYPFEKMPIYPNILSKVPSRVKNLNGHPKRVHISSHHYKYDIFYEDIKTTTKAGANVEALQPKLVNIATNTVRPMKLTHKRTSASEKEAKSPAVKNIDRTARRYRQRRRVWGSEAPLKKRKYFNFRGSKSKCTSGSTEPADVFETMKLSADLGKVSPSTGIEMENAISKAMSNTAEAARIWQTETISSPESTAEFSSRQEPFTMSKGSTGIISWTWHTEPYVDIEDVVTMLDKQDDIEDAVTLSAIQSEFFSSMTIRDSLRRALPETNTTATLTTAPTMTAPTMTAPTMTASTITAPTITVPTITAPTITVPTTTAPTATAAMTTAPTITTPTTIASLTTEATTEALTAASTTTLATTTTVATTTTEASTSQPGSLVYDLKQLKVTTSSKPGPEKETQHSNLEKDRHRRLFKISSMLHNRFRSMMRNLTANSKSSSVTSIVNATIVSPKYKRTVDANCCCIPTLVTIKVDKKEEMEEKAHPEEGFKVCIEPEYCVIPDEPGPPCKPQKEEEKPAEVHHYHHHLCETTRNLCQEPEPPPTVVHCHYHSNDTAVHHTTHKPKQCKPSHPEMKDPVVYIEPYEDQMYAEQSSQREPPVPNPETDCPEDAITDRHLDFKREATETLNTTYTAKDVAALEVIVDLMKNTVSYEDTNMPGLFQHSNKLMAEPYPTRPIHPNGSTNAIQVHIAIPFDFQNGRKRSPNSPVRVRKVFSAKMSTPVDLEYQVHSFEGSLTSSTAENNVSMPPIASNVTEDQGLSPGMYLLIDQPRSGFGLKPILGQFTLPDSKSQRQVTGGTTVRMLESKPTDSREETTSLKNLARVTLNKDFIAAINQQLIEMYENMTRVNKDVNNRRARSVWKSRKLKAKKLGRKRSAEKYFVKRGVDWDAVRHFFGHDRVCNCKCKSNTTMCRACAASDAVIDELIFEFDNIGRYMADHCTEIQTFFWMNPTGGQKLRESVNKIDKSLTDYYKRVKGKCQGRLCKTFTTYIDKRHLTKTFKVKKEDCVDRLINDLAVLAEDLNRTVSLKVCYNEKLKDSGEKFINLVNSVLYKKSLNKRSDTLTTPKKLIKNVYSLDNINVNIICNPESSTTADDQLYTATVTENQDTSQQIIDRFDLDIEEDAKLLKDKKSKGFRKLFPRKTKKSKLLAYFEIKKPKTNNKRQVDNQLVTPLISDGGGAFWYDYLKAGTNEPRLARESISYSPPTIEVSVVQKPATTNANISSKTPRTTDLALNTIRVTVKTHKTVDTKPVRDQREVETTTTKITTDNLSRNINEMLQLFGSLQDIEAMNNISKRSKQAPKKGTQIEKEIKPKKVSFVSKVKQKMDAWSKKATRHNKSTVTPPYKSTLSNKLKELKTIEHMIESDPKKAAVKNVNVTQNVLVVSTNATLVNESKLMSTMSMMSPTAETEASKSSANTTTEVQSTNTVRITSISLTIERQSETSPVIVNESTTVDFMSKINAASNLMNTDMTEMTSESTKETETVTTTEFGTDLIMPLNSGVIDIVTSVNSKDLDYVIEDSAQSSTPNPTMIIINECGGTPITTDAIADKEVFKNLLLSIIQFETNNLNDEWDRVAYVGDGHRNDADMKRSIENQRTDAPEKPTMKLMVKPRPPEVALYDYDPEIEISTKVEGLLNKIVNKMGIKVINKQKVVKKPKTREVWKDRKNFIKNRKIRINSYKSDQPTTFSKEASHSRRSAKPNQICDIQATFDHVKKLQGTLPPKTFEVLVKNISCYRYKNPDSMFVIPYKRKGKRWDWIRNKRSFKLHFYNKDEHFVDEEAYAVNFEEDSNDSFERFARGDGGIYKMVHRRKRRADLEDLERGLRNIPTLMPREDEVFVMAGDTVTMDCGLHSPVTTCDGKFIWKTDRSRMLKHDNVYVDNVSLTIQNVEPKNVGTYTCDLDHVVRKNVKLNVLVIPSFDVVFLTVYRTKDNCSYDDLKAIQRLGRLMANETRCGKSCSIRIDEPVCQRDTGTNSTLVKAAAVISMTPRELNCSLQCKRDIVSSLVMLCATNSAVLSSIKVLVSKDGHNETLTPWKDLVRPVVTHTLRKKDTNGHHEYHKLVSLLAPGKVDVVLICPAGYYLLPLYKLCSSCPPNTSSKTGDNTCRSCPRGTRAEPGASKCHLVQTHPRRYDWWWYPPCGYVVACCGVLFGCTMCALLSLIVHILSRDAELREQGAEDEEKTPLTRRVTVAYAHIPRTRPLSPSRVILPRFFRPSLTSSRATDSQETKFELWKERNIPPPLPPIDFDP